MRLNGPKLNNQKKKTISNILHIFNITKYNARNALILKEKELIKKILNIIKNNNFELQDPLEKNDNYIYLVLKKN